MNREEVQVLLQEARRVCDRCRGKPGAFPNHPDEWLNVLTNLIAAVETLLEEQNQFTGRLRRTSIFEPPPPLPEIKLPAEQPSDSAWGKRD